MSSDDKNNWAKEKERLSKLSLEQVRKEYFCGDKYTPVSQIPTWKKYYSENEKTLSEKVSEKDCQKFAEENDPDTESKDFSDKVSIYRGDITKLEIDAIVNAANERLLGGGGVDGAIHRGAGNQLLNECRTLNGCPTGEAKITSGYKLPAKFVIHTVGPVGEKPEALKQCYENSLDLMKENNLRTIAFPCISTGIYGYPNQNAAPIAIQTVKEFLEKNEEKVDRVIFCLFLEKDVDIYEKQLQLFFPLKSSL